MEAVALFVREVDKEVRWLAKRPKSVTDMRAHVASCLNLYGCLPSGPYGGSRGAGPRVQHQQDESDSRPVSEIINQTDSSHPELDVRPQPNRRKRKPVSYYNLVTSFGDLSKEPIKLVGKTLTSFTALISSQAKDRDALKALLGLPEPCQPFYFHGSFFAPRCKAWQCSAHQNKNAAVASSSSTNPEERAYAAIAWSKSEPMSTPPICSCREPSRVKNWVAALQRAVELLENPPATSEAATVPALEAPNAPVEPMPVESPAVQSPRVTETPAVLDTPAELNTPAMAGTPSLPMIDSPKAELVIAQPRSPAEELEDLERTLLMEASNCKSCGGLCYYPFSFIEVFLNSHMNNLNEFQNVFADLPPYTDVCCDGPHITATICCKSPKHEWKVFEALSQKEFAQAPIIYDICSQWFTPGIQSRPGQKRWHEKEVPYSPTPGPADTLLDPPRQRFLNCSKVVTSGPDMQTITSLAARRPYCIRVRENINVLEISERVRQARAEETSPDAQLVSVLKEHEELSKKHSQLERDLETLHMDALATEVCTPWFNKQNNIH